MPKRPRPLAPYPAAVWSESLRHRGLVLVVAIRHLGRGLDLDDLVQEGLIGACRAVETFDPSRGLFHHHLARWARHAMQEAIWKGGAMVRRTARASRRRARWPLEAALASTPDHEPRVDPRKWADVLAALDALDAIAPELSAVVRLRYGLDGDALTLEQVARRFSCSRQTIANLEKTALDAIRGQLDPSATASAPPPRRHRPRRVPQLVRLEVEVR